MAVLVIDRKRFLITFGVVQGRIIEVEHHFGLLKINEDYHEKSNDVFVLASKLPPFCL